MLGGTPAGRAGITPRVVNTILGAWLVVSVLLWRHWGPEGFNTLMTGLLVIAVAPLAVWAPALRYGTAFLGAWLFATTFVFVHARGFTFWHDLVAALAVLAVALVPSRPWEYRRAGA